MSKAGITQAIADEHELKRSSAAKTTGSLATIGATEVQKTGKLENPDLCMIKTRQKPTTKDGKQEVFDERHDPGEAGTHDHEGIPVAQISVRAEKGSSTSRPYIFCGRCIAMPSRPT